MTHDPYEPPQPPQNQREKQNESCAELETLGAFLKRMRLARRWTLDDMVQRCGGKMRKQFLCDLEHGRRGQKIRELTAIRLASALDIPLSEITSRVRTRDAEARNYADYHRVLRSRVRAGAALSHMTRLREQIAVLQIALKGGVKGVRDMSRQLQQLETTVELLDETLSYKKPLAKRWAHEEGDDAKFRPVRPVASSR